MPKYLLQVNYTAEGARGLVDEGGSARRAAAENAVDSIGGRIESFYYAFGKTDVFVIAEVPDHASMAALSLALAASGATAGRTTVLLTPEDVDKAARKSPLYRPPGQDMVDYGGAEEGE